MLAHNWIKMLADRGRAMKMVAYTVACESIHSLGIFPIFLPFNLELKFIFWGGYIIWFTQHAYHFEDAKYFLLWNKQEIRQKNWKLERE